MGSLRFGRPQELWWQRDSEPVGPVLCDSLPSPAAWGPEAGKMHRLSKEPWISDGPLAGRR